MIKEILVIKRLDAIYFYAEVLISNTKMLVCQERDFYLGQLHIHLLTQALLRRNHFLAEITKEGQYLFLE